MKTDSTKDYLSCFRSGGESGFEYFFNTYYDRLNYFAQRFISHKDVAEDIISDAFINLWQKREIFTDEVYLRNYLYATIRNACIRWLENQQRYSRHNQLAAFQLERTEQSCIENIIRAETLHHIYQALEHLPPACRSIFRKLYIEGRSVKETATELRLAVSTVKNQKLRGISLLRANLEL